MSRYNSNFREPPWVIGSPKEVMDWIDATHPKKVKHEKDDEKKYLTNLHIKFDFDVSQKEIKMNGIFAKLSGRKMIEEDLDVLSSTELILRGLAKAKFKNTAKIVVDGAVVYHHPEKKTDLKDTIQVINEFSEKLRKGKQLEITALLDDFIKCTAIIKVKKIHYLDEHSMDIQINGKIRKEIYHTFLNYLTDKIGFKDNIQELTSKQ
jgi:hypothetical protein